MNKKTLLIPDTVERELRQKTEEHGKKLNTPTCPACGAKFQHDNRKAKCKVCGLPDEIRAAGESIVIRWKKQNHIGKLLRERRRAAADKSKIVLGGSAGRKRNKHGRKGVS
jgi:hypothetical protein